MQHFTQSDDHPLRSSNANRRAGLFVLCLLLTLLLAACAPITDSGRKIESAVSGSGSVSPKDVASEIL